ncbi:hypothetical protein Naga_101930g1 [Nannochloropsis gaditana]|uniref:Uncharacterized protein n=1 Tax=Nannochloropsis gaditana TaxID=72520 RepID=W7TJ70_9STRA|nr:hypothetical protein Naga_101930g1 [Nannochloropsis gaditana]
MVSSPSSAPAPPSTSPLTSHATTLDAPPINPPPPDLTALQHTLWMGAIPVELFMKESEVAGPSVPAPHYASSPSPSSPLPLSHLPLVLRPRVSLLLGTNIWPFIVLLYPHTF